MLGFIKSWLVRRTAAAVRKEVRRLQGATSVEQSKAWALWDEHSARQLKKQAAAARRAHNEAAKELEEVAKTNRRVGVHRCFHRDPIVYVTPVHHASAIPTVPRSEPAAVGVVTGYEAILPKLPKIDVMKQKMDKSEGWRSFDKA
jgi:hypothetical protein